jgi:hypothetical protein
MMYVQGMDKIMDIGIPVVFTPVFLVRHATHCMSLEQMEVVHGSTKCWGFLSCVKLIFRSDTNAQCLVQVTSYYLLNEINVL